jgi:hypothetical protein
MQTHRCLTFIRIGLSVIFTWHYVFHAVFTGKEGASFIYGELEIFLYSISMQMDRTMRSFKRDDTSK